MKKKYSFLSAIYFIVTFGVTYLLMPHVMDILNLSKELELKDKIKNGHIFIEFVVFVVLYLLIAFLFEIFLRFLNKFRNK